MSLKNKIEAMVRASAGEIPNHKIYSALKEMGYKCSKRTVRRYANPLKAQLKDHVLSGLPKILLFDVETAPMEVFVWSLRQHGWISPENVQKDWSILTWSAKWLFDSEIMSAKVHPMDAFLREDRSVIEPIWNLFDKADIIIAHNGARFDVRKLNARFAIYNLDPPMPYRVIDTLRVTKRQFELSSYKLDYVNKLFGLTQKGHPGYQTWKDCVCGNQLIAGPALDKLEEYCKRDVRILEDLYLQLRPWIKSHPNVALFIDTDQTICTNCGSEDLDWHGKYYTPAGRYKAFRCDNCGAIGRSRYSDLTPAERKKLNLSVAR